MIYTKWMADWSALTFSRDILAMFDSPNTLVFSTTWTSNEQHNIIHQWLADSPSNNVVVISMFDPLPNQDVIIDDRVVNISTKDFWFWLLAVSKNFLPYTTEEVQPSLPFKYKFLCYQRKPFYFRKQLFDDLKDQGGLITLGSQDHEFNKQIPQHRGITESSKVFKTPEEFFVMPCPNDIWSLGNIDVWNSSFLNIVSETVHTDLTNPHFFFLSEKILKPIIGCRPFICHGHSNTSSYLRARGYETFDDDFGYAVGDHYHVQANNIGDAVKNIHDAELLYKKLLPKIMHNKNNFKQSVIDEGERLNNLVAAFHNTYNNKPL